MKKRKHIFIPLFIFLGACVICLVISIINFKVVNKTSSYSYEVIQLNFDGASDGVDPNGNPLNPVAFLTDDVIETALTNSNMNYDVNVIRQYIAVENIVPKGIVEEIENYTSVIDTTSSKNITTNDYIPVRYKFVLYHDLDKKLSSSDLNKLLNNIVDAYLEKFYTTYKKTFDTTNYNELYVMDNYDYIYQVEVLTNKIRVLTRSASSIYADHDDFSVNGKTFNDITVKGNKIIANDVSRINNIIILNALSKDIDRLKDYYNYKIEMLNYDKVKYTADLNNVTTQLNNYQKDSTVYVGSGENLVKVESNSSETYNYLASRQIEIASKIASINSEITDYQNTLNDINNAVSTEEDYVLVRNLISKLGNDYNALEAEYEEMINAYNTKYILPSSVSKTELKYQSSSIVSLSFVVRAAKISAPIILVVLLGICVYYLARQSKKKKEQMC